MCTIFNFWSFLVFNDVIICRDWAPSSKCTWAKNCSGMEIHNFIQMWKSWKSARRWPAWRDGVPATAIYHSDLRSARKRETLAATAMPETRPALRAEAGNGQIQALQAEKKTRLKIGLKWYLEISKNALVSQKMVDIVDNVDTVEAIWNKARLCNNQSQKT